MDICNLSWWNFDIVIIKFISNSEKKNKPLIRKSIFASKDIKKNEIINLKNIKILRPLIGIPAENIFKILNKRVKKKIFKNTPIYKNLIVWKKK